MKRLLLAVTILLAASQVWAAGGRGYVGTTAPATCEVGNFWIDTDGTVNDRFYTCTAANTWTKNSGGDNLGSAAYSDVVALWTTCTGYLKSDGTCDIPSGSATYPSAAGVAYFDGTTWGTSYTVGTAANNLVQLNASAQLPAVSADLLTFTDTGSYFTTDTVGAALQELGGAPELFFDSGDFVEDTSVPGRVTVSLAAAVAGDDLGGATASDVANLFSGSGDYLKADGSTGTPTGGSYPEGYMEIDGGNSTSTTFAGVIDGGASI